MKHARPDYAYIDDFGQFKIAEDEPVFLLRAKDQIAPSVVEHWAALMYSYTEDKNMSEMARNHAKLMREWQQKNGCKLPDFTQKDREIDLNDLMLRQEIAELEYRIRELKKFINSAEYANQTLFLRRSYTQQLSHMGVYCDILIARKESLDSFRYAGTMGESETDEKL